MNFIIYMNYIYIHTYILTYIYQDTVRIKEHVDYTKQVQKALRSQEADIEKLILVSPIVQKWNAEPIVEEPEVKSRYLQ